MQFFTVAAALFFAAAVNAQGSACFDDFDCFAAGGHCVKGSTDLLGTCGSATSSSAAPAPTSGSVCFDAGDCILAGGGQCVKPSATSITGYCVGGSSSFNKAPKAFAA